MKNLKLVWLVLLTIFFVGSVFAQETSKIEEQCKISPIRSLFGGKITISGKVGIRDILNIVTKQYGCKFVVDNSVTQIIYNVDVTDVPWSLLLRGVLENNKLAIQKNGSVFRVAKVETFEEEKKWLPLFNEFIKLSYIPNQTSLDKETLLRIVKHRLSFRGSIELNENSNTLKLTDVRENLDAIKSLIEIIDVKGDWKELLEQNRDLKPVPSAKPN